MIVWTTFKGCPNKVQDKPGSRPSVDISFSTPSRQGDYIMENLEARLVPRLDHVQMRLVIKKIDGCLIWTVRLSFSDDESYEFSKQERVR
jgi:hypothetical protein